MIAIYTKNQRAISQPCLYQSRARIHEVSVSKQRHVLRLRALLPVTFSRILGFASLPTMSVFRQVQFSFVFSKGAEPTRAHQSPLEPTRAHSLEEKIARS